MEPEFGNASLLLVAHAGFDELQPGMVVVYRDQAGDLVAHKVLQATAGGWIVKGLNNDRADPGLVTAENLRGVVFGILNYDPESTKLAAADQPTVAYAKQY
jgi:signal peptidase I